MAPVFQAVGAQQNSTGASVNVAWPTHLADDIGLVVIETSGNSATLTPPAGWAAIPGTPVTDVATIAGSKLHVWWRRATSSAMGTVATGAATDHIVARLYTFRGCVTTGNPWNVTTTGTKTTASTTATVPALVTTLDDTLITMIVGRPDDSSSTTHFGVPVNAGLTGLAEAAEAGTINGNGGGFVVSYGIEATPGSTGTSTLSKGASTTDTYVVLALKAPTELIHTVGTFTLAGTTTGLLQTSTIIGTTGTFSLVGNNVDFSKSVSLDVNVGTFTYDGTTTGLLFNGNLIQQTGTFSVDGKNIDLTRLFYLDTDLGKFFLPERNLRQYSEEFNNAYWTKTNSSITANSTAAPDGTLTADTLIENTSAGAHSVNRTFTYVAGKTYTASCYFKPGPGPAARNVRLQLGNATTFGSDTYININPTAGTIIGSSGSPSATSIASVGNGWHRASITKQYTGAGATQNAAIALLSSSTSSYTGDSTSGVYIWGVQFEEGDLTDYDPTGASSAVSTQLLFDRNLIQQLGTFSLDGNDSLLQQAVRINATSQTYDLAGTTTTLAFNRALVGQTGTFTIAGVQVDLTFISSGIAYTLDQQTGTFALAGTSLGLNKQFELLNQTGLYTLSGKTLGFIRALALHSVPGSFSVSGKDAVFSLTRSFDLTTGTYTVNRNNADVNRFYQLNNQPGTYQVVGSGLDYFSTRNLVTLPLNIITDFRSVGNFFWYQTTQTIQPVKYKITKRNEFILGRQTHMGRRGL